MRRAAGSSGRSGHTACRTISRPCRSDSSPRSAASCRLRRVVSERATTAFCGVARSIMRATLHSGETRPRYPPSIPVSMRLARGGWGCAKTALIANVPPPAAALSRHEGNDNSQCNSRYPGRHCQTHRQRDSAGGIRNRVPMFTGKAGRRRARQAGFAVQRVRSANNASGLSRRSDPDGR